jgi:hypothetical protein
MALMPLKARAGIAAQIPADGIPHGSGFHVHKFPFSSVEAIMSRRALGIAAALITMPFMGLPVWGAPCETASVDVYTAAGFSCSVGDKTFSDMHVAGIPTGNATLPPDVFVTPFISGNEFGLQLLFSAVAGPSPPSGSTTLTWTYNVDSVVPMIDALLQLVGNTTGTGMIVVNEQLDNGVGLTLNAAGTTTATFAPINHLHVSKANTDISGAMGFATSAILTNAFSQVPGPLVGAGLPGLILAGGVLLLLARRRRQLVA